MPDPAGSRSGTIRAHFGVFERRRSSNDRHAGGNTAATRTNPDKTRQLHGTTTTSPSQAQASAPPTATAAKKKKKSLVLSDEQEMELADWLKENPMLYTKSMKEYKDTAKKIDLWNSKAAELDLESGPLLKTWYESVRTKVGKLSDKKSGSATKDMTDRDTFLMQNFGFLASHIARVKGRPACSVSINLHYYCDFSCHFYYMML